MTTSELINLLNELRSYPAETEWIEFKTKKFGVSDEEFGEYISAMSNGAAIKYKPFGYFVWGVEDKTHDVVGTSFTFVNAKHGKNQDLEFFLQLYLTPKINFEIFEFDYQGKHIVLLRIPAAKGEPTEFQKKPYIRIGSNKTELRNFPKLMRKIYNSEEDWSEKIVKDATLDDLDPEAILKARENYKEKYPALAEEVDKWDDITFLNKAKITLNGKITNTAILLLGKDESEHFLVSADAKIRWILKSLDNRDKDYEIFCIPFILTIDKVLAKIRNLKYRYMPDGTLFPREVLRYDPCVIRETLNNAIAHQDYTEGGRINLVEFEDDHILFTNLGSFIPGTVENVIDNDAPTEQYRNKFLSTAMLNLNLVDTIGSGIIKMFDIQRKRFFPLPDYNFTPDRVEVTITGKLLDMNFVRVLTQNPEISIDDVILLDRVQKKLPLTDIEADHLRGLKLVKGKGISLEIVAKTTNPTELINELSPRQQIIINYVKEHGSISIAISQEITGKSRNTVADDLKEMVENGILKRDGETKGTIFTLA
jgi:ATP-dependent DNA helicase RecG